MLGPNYILMGRVRGTMPPPPTFDADYQAVLTYATSKGWALPNAAVQTAGNDLVVALKAAGIWAKRDVLFVFATNGDANFACIDWKNPSDTTNATRVNDFALTFTANQGFTGNGTSSFIDTNYNPSTFGGQFTLTNAGYEAYLFAASGTGSICGQDNATINKIARNDIAGHGVNSSNNLSATFDYTATAGLKSIHRTSGTDITLANGATTAARTGSVLGSVPNSKMTVLKNVTLFGAHTVSTFGAGASLVSELSDYNTAINTYIAAL
jgi:hypothetical protein